MSGYPVIPPSEKDGTLTTYEILNPTTTRQKLSFPSGIKWASISYRLVSGTAVASQRALFCVGASSDADADGKLALNGGYIPMVYGDDVQFSSDGTATRLDFITTNAIAAEISIIRVLVGV